MSRELWAFCSKLAAFLYHHPNALGIGAASFWSAAEKDIAESPTAELEAETERPNKEDYKSTRLHDYKLLG